jgi:uncharacterized protein YbjT (DUF2867 family)
MVLPKVLVTGATGRTGSVVVSQLLQAGYPVRALVHREDERTAALRTRGIEIAIGEMTDFDGISAAMQGVQRAYWLPPYDPEMLTGAVVFASAAKRARLESIVVLTQWLASPSHPALMTRHHWLADQVFAMLPDSAVTTVNPGFFAETPYLATISLAAHLGVFPWMFGAARAAPPSVVDIGRVAAAALMNPARHAGRTYRPTGPQLLSGEDMARILGLVFERDVRMVPTPMRIFLKGAHLDGHPLVLLASMAHYMEEHRRGAFASGAPNDHVQQVTGRPAESFEAVVRRLATHPRNQRSTANALREIARFIRTPLVRMPSLSGYLRGLHITAPPRPEYTDESATWQREHGLSGLAIRQSFSQPQPATESLT